VNDRADAVIDVRGVTKRYGDRTALEDLSLQVGAGEVVALLGPNGAGKTTTLRILAGVIAPSAGTGRVAGVAVDGGPRQQLRARVGLLTEAPGLWDRLAVRVNLLTYARLYGVASPAARVDAVLAQLGLAGRAGDAAGVLSKGMRQRVALARALVAAPAVLLLDEPTSGLDPDAARTVRDLVRDARGRGTAVLLSTHQLDEAEALADRIAVLQRRLLALDTPSNLRARLAGRPRVAVTVDGAASRWQAALSAVAADITTDGPRLEFALTAGRDVPDAVAALTAAGARIRAVGERTSSLEEAYLALVHRHE
jgi:ABC-2 type transport system ATP-binding protein